MLDISQTGGSSIWRNRSPPGKKYDGRNDPHEHLIACQTTWVSRLKDESVHAFVHPLDKIPRIWYVFDEL